jgi:anti-sigma factor RsiW
MNAYNHQPFEDWILSGNPLDEGQRATLQEHLRVCDTCRRRNVSWNGVRHLMQAAGQVAPASGFTARWHLALEVRRVAEARQQRLAWALFGLCIALSLAALLGLVWQFFGMVQAPQWFIVAVLMVWTELTVASRMITEILQQIPLVAAPFILGLLVLFAGITSIFSVLWVVLYRQLAVRRVVL